MIRILYTLLDPTADSAHWEQLLCRLPKSVQDWIGRYTSLQHRRQRITGKYLLLALMKQYGLYPRYSLDDLAYTTDNKPFIAGTDFHYSISHSEQLVVCAAAMGQPVGIDTEQLKPLRLDLMQTYFDTATWQLIIAADNPLKACYREWVRREAALKASGTGLQELEMSSLIAEAAFIQVQDTRYETHALYLADDYITWLAATKITEPVSVHYFRMPFV